MSKYKEVVFLSPRSLYSLSVDLCWLCVIACGAISGEEKFSTRRISLVSVSCAIERAA